MNRLAYLSAIALLCGCESLSISVPEPSHPSSDPQPANEPHTPAEPSPEPPPVERVPAGPYSHLQQRKSFSPKSSVELKKARYVGDDLDEPEHHPGPGDEDRHHLPERAAVDLAYEVLHWACTHSPFVPVMVNGPGT